VLGVGFVGVGMVCKVVGRELERTYGEVCVMRVVGRGRGSMQ
jgi:hypothetical protein